MAYLRTIALILIFCVLAPGAATAHDGAARIELSAERLQPGATLEVRGINIAPTLPVQLTLLGASMNVALGNAVGDAHGDFTLAVVLPTNLKAGNYSVQATGANRTVAGAPLLIAGTPILPEAEGLRDEGEPLLAPMPPAQPAATISPNAPSLAAAPVAAPPAPAAAVAPYGSSVGVVVLIVLVGLVCAFGVVYTRRRSVPGKV